MANNFLNFKKYKIGSSLIEKNIDKTVGKIYEIAKNENCNLIIPEDCKVGTDFLSTLCQPVKFYFTNHPDVDRVRNHVFVSNLIPT